MKNDTITPSWEAYETTVQRNSFKHTGKLVAFGAVAATGLVACNEVEADIIYSGPLNIVVGLGSTQSFDFDGDAANDLLVQIVGTPTSASFDADGLNGGGVWGDPVIGSTYANKFAFGDLIPGVATATGLGWMGFYAGGVLSDPWGALQAGINGSGPVNGFLGFTFNGFNGWMELSLAADGAGAPVSMTVLGWAYDNTGAPIAAGNIGAVPEPGTAGLLALGTLALGAVGLRRKRIEAA